MQDPILLLAGPSLAYLAVIAVLLFGSFGLVIAIIGGLALVTLGTRISADTMLSLYRAEPLGLGQGAALREAVATLSARADLPEPPALAIIPSLAVGAFGVGTGQRRAILLTEGLVRRHGLPELAAIAAHEIAHMRAGDMPRLALADTITRVAQAMFYLGLVLAALSAILWLAGEGIIDWLTIALLIAAPTLSSQLQLALPRDHDYAADDAAARLLGDRGLMARVAESGSSDTGNLLDDLRIPVPQRHVPLPSVFRAHPAGFERARRIRTDEPATLPPLLIRDEPLISLAGVGPIEMKPRDRWPGLWF